MVGPSGCGKSSLVKAGLIPALRNGQLPGSEKWFIVKMLPGAHPFEELEISLLRLAIQPGLDLGLQLRRDKRGLLRAARLALPSPDDQLLLVVDQFEELFTLVEDEAEARLFLSNLYEAVSDPRSPVRVVITLRADFYDRPLLYPDFSKLMQGRTEVVVPLELEELERAIQAPAEHVGVEIDAGLVASIVADVLEQPGALPLLQYALTELFERRKDHRLRQEAYQAIGGVQGVLGKRAEEIYTSMDEKEQALARQIFLRLITLGEGIEDTRRRVLIAELQSLTEQPLSLDLYPLDEIGERRKSVGNLRGVLDAFGVARLLTFDRDPHTRAPTVEVAHEALLKEWGRLKGWLDESRADVRLQRLLASSAVEWWTEGRDPSFLLRGVRLAHFEEWIQTTSIALTGEERLYMETSLAERRRQEEEEATRRMHEATLEHRWRLQASIGLAAQALTELDGAQPERAVLLALEALEHYPYTPQAESALAQAVQHPNYYRTFLAQEQVTGLEWSSDGKQVFADKRYKSVIVLDAITGDAIRELPFPVGDIIRLTLSPDGSRLLIAPVWPEETDATCWPQIWDIHTGTDLLSFSHASRAVAWSPSGNKLVTAGYFDGMLRIWDSQTGEELFKFKGLEAPGSFMDVVWLPDGRLATVAGESDNDIRFWDSDTGDELLQVQQYVPVALDMSPDGQKLVVGSEQGAMILDAYSGKPLIILSGHSGVVENVVWSPDGNWVATAGWDLTARIWNVSTGKEVQRLPLLDYVPRVDGLAWSPDGERLLITGYRGFRMWHLTQHTPRLLGHTGNVNEAQFSPDGRLLIAGGFEDATIHIWEVASGKEIRTLETTEAGMLELTWSPDSTRVIVSDGAHEIARMWNVHTGELLFEFALQSGYYYSFGWSPDGSKIAAGGNFPVKVLDLLDASTGQRIFSMEKSEEGIFLRPSWSPAGDRFVASCYETNKAYIWDANTGRIVQELISEPENKMRNAVWSPDGTRIAIGYMNGLAQVWGVATGQVETTFAGHGDLIQDLAWSPDSRRIVSGGNDYLVKIWDASSGEELFTYNASGFLMTVDWSSTGEYVVASKYNDNEPLVLRAWQSTEDLIAYAKECCVWRELTQEERQQFGLPEQ